MSTAEAASRARVLMVDDRLANLVALQAVLEPLGEHLVHARSGSEAIARLGHEDFAAVLLDVQMPGLDGFETAAEIRRGTRNSDVPIVFVTAYDNDDARAARGYAQGAIDYVAKPFDPGMLRAKVAALIGLWRRAEQLRDELRASETGYRFLADSMPALVWTADPSGAIDYVNRVFADYVGPDASVLGSGWAAVLHPADLAHSLERESRAREAGAPYEIEQRVRRADGNYRWFLSRAVPMRDAHGTVARWFGTSIDIEDFKRAQTERAIAIARAEASYRDTQEVNRIKDEFLSVVSHELRTPLHAIVGWTHMLRGDRLDAAGRARALETIERNAAAQTKLVEDILDVSRIITGKLRVALVPIDPTIPVEQALHAIRPAAAAKGVHLDVHLGPHSAAVLGDADRLQQVVWNLLANAVKFTPKGGHVTVTLTHGGPSVELRVADTGTGIDPRFMPFVFERFCQADAGVTRMYGGLGLGLSIARHLVELHGGSIEARSSGKGRGACFTVSIPTVVYDAGLASRAVGRERAFATPPELNGVRVLIMAVDAVVRDAADAALRTFGATTVSVATAVEGLDTLRRERPDVLVVDLEMHGGEGSALIRRVRALDRASGGCTPAVALMADTLHEDRTRALSAGFHQHAAKPVDPSELTLVVGNLAGRFTTP